MNLMVRTCNRKNVCKTMPCIRKCCPNNQGFYGEKRFQCATNQNYSNQLTLDFYDIHMENDQFISADIMEPKEFGILHGLECLKYSLEPESDDFDQYYISVKDGSLHLPNQNSILDHSKYCIDKLESTNQTAKMVVFICFENTNQDNIKFQLYAVGILISCGFFTITLLVYLCVPKLRNLPGKILICLVFSLLIAYLGIAFGQLSPPGDQLCYTFAFFIYYSSMAAFAWMNVMCFDIWLTFGTTKRTRGIPFDRNDTRRFLLYTLYALGLPAVFTLSTILLTRYNIIHDNLQPKFGEGRCWFQYAHAASHIVFFLAPVGILFLINFILFILTLKYCNQVKREIHRMQSTVDDKPMNKSRFTIDRARFMMNTKLFIVMGITWFLEILSTIFYDRSNMFFWIISDIFNVLQGVLVFFIFVFKWRVWDAICDRFGMKVKKRKRNGATTTAATTSTFTGSTGNLNVIRMKSMESNSSLINQTITATNSTATK